MSSSTPKHLYAIIVALAFLPLYAAAQISITELGKPAFNENFDKLTSSGGDQPWENNTTIQGMYVQQGAAVPTSLKASHGEDRTSRLYSFGYGEDGSNAQDRSLGGISTPETGQFFYVVRLKNNTTKTIDKINVTFMLEQWWNNPGSSERFILSYKTGSTNEVESIISSRTLHTATGWQSNSRIFTPTKGQPGPRVPADTKSVSADLNLTLTAGQEILVRFEDAMSTKKHNDNAIGIDDVVITPYPYGGTAKIFHYVNSNGKNKDELTITTNWNSKKDGTGTPPVNFTDDFQQFLIDVPNRSNGNGNGNGNVNSQINTESPSLSANWTVSGIGSKVIISDETKEYSLTIAPTAAFSGTVDVLNKGTFRMNNSNNGTITIGQAAVGSTIAYGATTSQNVLEADYYNLAIFDGSGPKTLTGNTDVRGDLNLNNSNDLTLENYNLTINPAGKIVREAGSYVVTNAFGTLQMTVANNDANVFFPVGLTSYNPVKIKQNAASVTDVFSVRVQSGLFDDYDDNDKGILPAVADGISRTWIINEAQEGNANATVTLLFSANNSRNDWAPLFDLEKASSAQYNEEDWVISTAGKATATAENMMEISQSNTTTFRIFGVMNNDHEGSTLLPVELVSFDAARKKAAVELKWQTAMEKNNDYFTLEQSTDGHSFTAFAKVKGVGNTNQVQNYSYVQQNAPAIATYYRLKQTDFDGTTSYSKIVVVNGFSNLQNLVAYPNPSTGSYTLQGAPDITAASVLDQTGRTVMQINNLNKEASLNFDLSAQQAGVYFLRLNTISGVKTLRLIKN